MKEGPRRRSRSSPRVAVQGPGGRGPSEREVKGRTGPSVDRKGRGVSGVGRGSGKGEVLCQGGVRATGPVWASVAGGAEREATEVEPAEGSPQRGRVKAGDQGGGSTSGPGHSWEGGHAPR